MIHPTTSKCHLWSSSDINLRHTLSHSMLSLPPWLKICLPFGSNLSPLTKHVDKMQMCWQDGSIQHQQWGWYTTPATQIYVCTQFDYRNHNDIDHIWATTYPCHWTPELKEHQCHLQTALQNPFWTNKVLKDFFSAFDRDMTKWDLTINDQPEHFPKILKKLTKIQNDSNHNAWSCGIHFTILGPCTSVNDATHKFNLLNIVNLQTIAKNQFSTVKELAKGE